MLNRSCLALAALLLTFSAARTDEPKTWPAHVLIIRHAEKPADANEVGLTAKGKERARALAKLFDRTNRQIQLPKPDFIFAARNSKKSHRSTATVAPLARKLGLKVNDTYANADYAKLARDLFRDRRYAGKTILICWHHGNIPSLANKLKANTDEKWKDSTFDRVWRIDYRGKGKVQFHSLPQRLLDGDSKK